MLARAKASGSADTRTRRGHQSAVVGLSIDHFPTMPPVIDRERAMFPPDRSKMRERVLLDPDDAGHTAAVCVGSMVAAVEAKVTAGGKGEGRHGFVGVLGGDRISG